MLFSSMTFIYYFLPVILLCYFAAPRKLKNMVLLFGSLFFYAWPEWRGMWGNTYLYLIVGASLVGWGFGFFIDRSRGMKRAKYYLTASIIANVGILTVFKYTDFVIVNLNRLMGFSSPEDFVIGLVGIALPVGISFYTFQILSYSIDLYRGEVEIQKNFLHFLTYVSLFPQLIAGPIVRYRVVEKELTDRQVTLSGFGEGAGRFVIGLSKKVLLANVLGQLCQFYQLAEESSVLFTWLYVLAFALQIYFDFSGYSDMAIGLGRMFGFHFPENFRYPYIATSVTEFWRRWHISLGYWFRDYVYIPLGGNRKGPIRHVLNILLVWFLTGLWHGAGWNFILWGLYFGVLLLLERYWLGRLLEGAPKAVSWLVMLFFVLLSWVFFDASSLGEAVLRLGNLFGVGTDALAGQMSLYYLRSFGVTVLIACVGATPLPKILYERALEHSAGRAVLTVAQPLVTAGLLLLVTAYLVDGSFNPFIYFRF